MIARARLAAGSGVTGAVVERGGSGARSASSRRTPARLHAVPERAEHRRAAVEHALVVARVVGARRAPHDEDRLVGRLATSMRSRVNGSTDDTTAPVIGHDDDVDLRVGDDGVEDLAAPLVARRRPTAVDRVRHPQVRGISPSCSIFCVSFVSGGRRRSAAASHVGHVRAGAAGDRVDAHPAHSSASPTPARLGWVREDAGDFERARRGRRRG